MAVTRQEFRWKLQVLGRSVPSSAAWKAAPLTATIQRLLPVVSAGCQVEIFWVPTTAHGCYPVQAQKAAQQCTGRRLAGADLILARSTGNSARRSRFEAGVVDALLGYWNGSQVAVHIPGRTDPSPTDPRSDNVINTSLRLPVL